MKEIRFYLYKIQTDQQLLNTEQENIDWVL